MRPDVARQVDKMIPNCDNLAGFLAWYTGRTQTMIKCKLVTLAFLSTVVLGSVFARVGATPMDDHCVKLRRATCCHEQEEYCQGFGVTGCIVCCGQIVINEGLLVLEPSASGWSIFTTFFPVDTSWPECHYYKPICVSGSCDVESFLTQTFCIGFLPPGVPHNCP